MMLESRDDGIEECESAERCLCGSEKEISGREESVGGKSSHGQDLCGLSLGK